MSHVFNPQTGEILINNSSIETQPTSYTPVYRGTNQSNVTVARCKWNRKGRYMYIDFNFQFTGQVDSVASVWYWELPVIDGTQSYIDTADTGTSITNAGRFFFGSCMWFQAGVAWKPVYAVMEDAGTGGLFYRIRFAENPGYVTMTQLTTSGGNNSCLQGQIKIPINGWS